MIPDDITPKDCYNTAGWFCSLANAKESTWKGKILRGRRNHHHTVKPVFKAEHGATWATTHTDYGIDPYLMHWTALQLLQQPVKNIQLALYMLKTAAEFDYDPSVIASVRFIQRSLRESGSQRARIFFQPVTEKFTKLVRDGQNPDALTLQALIEMSRGKKDKALSYLDRAIFAAANSNNIFAPAPTKNDHLDYRMAGPLTGSQREPRWGSEAECYYHLGIIQAHRGQLEAAEASFRIGALELDDARSYLELAKLLPKDSPEHHAHLIKAAISGNRDALPQLCDYENQRCGRKKDGDGPLWAREWALVWKDGQADLNSSPTL